jgi:hypothetical protein
VSNVLQLVVAVHRLAARYGRLVFRGNSAVRVATRNERLVFRGSSAVRVHKLLKVVSD